MKTRDYQLPATKSCNEVLPVRIHLQPGAVKTFVIVGGSGDYQDKFDPLIKELSITFPKYNLVTFSFRGYETGKQYTNQQLIEDIYQVIDFLVQEQLPPFTLMAASRGAYSTSYLLTDKDYQRFIESVVFYDSADFYQGDDNFLWDGASDYKPDKPVVSDLMSNVSPQCKVHVINCTLRNTKDGDYVYAENGLRGKAIEDGYPRMNNDMVRAFYEKLPTASKGEYVEDNTLPHAFIRDGDAKYNVKQIVKHLRSCLN